MKTATKHSISRCACHGALLLATVLSSPPVTAVDTCPANVKFPASGQKQSYAANQNDGNTAAVTVPDDGKLQTGFTQRFRDNRNGTVTDRTTGLIWEKKGDDGGPHDKDNRYAWSLDPAISEDTSDRTKDTIWDFLDTINRDRFAGHGDWRIPDIKELQSLVSYGQANPAIHAAFKSPCELVGIDNVTGSCTVADAYWSSTTDPDTPENAMNLIFDDGDLFSGDKFAALFARAVRGGCK
jgi:hypothetical protein